MYKPTQTNYQPYQVKRNQQFQLPSIASTQEVASPAKPVQGWHQQARPVSGACSKPQSQSVLCCILFWLERPGAENNQPFHGWFDPQWASQQFEHTLTQAAPAKPVQGSQQHSPAVSSSYPYSSPVHSLQTPKPVQHNNQSFQGGFPAGSTLQHAEGTQKLEYAVPPGLTWLQQSPAVFSSVVQQAENPQKRPYPAKDFQGWQQQSPSVPTTGLDSKPGQSLQTPQQGHGIYQSFQSIFTEETASQSPESAWKPASANPEQSWHQPFPPFSYNAQDFKPVQIKSNVEETVSQSPGSAWKPASANPEQSWHQPFPLVSYNAQDFKPVQVKSNVFIVSNPLMRPKRLHILRSLLGTVSPTVHLQATLVQLLVGQRAKGYVGFNGSIHTVEPCRCLHSLFFMSRLCCLK